MLRTVEQGLGRLLLHDLAGAHDSDAVREVPGDAQVVGDEHVSEAVAGLELAQQVPGPDEPGPAGGAGRCWPGPSRGSAHAVPAICQALAWISFHNASIWARVVQIEPTATRT